MLRRRCQLATDIVFMLAGMVGCIQVELRDNQVHGLIGRSLHLDARYIMGTWHDIHSVTWKVQRASSLRIFQYVMETSKMYLSPAYKGRVQFHRENGSLTLYSFKAQDEGMYRIIVTDNEGSEHSASIQVLVYEQVSRPVIATFQTSTNMILSCLARNGTEQSYRWFKDGERLPEKDQSAVSEDGRNLTLLSLGTAFCGVYTCLVRNQLSAESVNRSITEYDGVLACREPPKALGKNLHISLIAVGIIVALLLAICIYVKVRAARARGL
ncbi:hepatic and glial cell adhesion molecule-like [Heptranchias perlo]|uniref:hepatic and glial cell adhesion molecule-like n=1 Tax=Heptranchias perlo TaxID=212740 RepID=UPI00355AA78C